jgi:hypothetical protein
VPGMKRPNFSDDEPLLRTRMALLVESIGFQNTGVSPLRR